MIISIVTAVLLILGGASYYFLGNNNPVEVAAESAIQAETGEKVDISAIAQDVGVKPRELGKTGANR